MNEWLIEGNIIVRVGFAVFVILFCINGIAWLSSKRMGKIPLGDFILLGILFLFIFFNQEQVISFSMLIPDFLGIAVVEVNEKIDDIGQDINRVRKVVKDVTSTASSFYSGKMLEELDNKATYTLPPIK